MQLPKLNPLVADFCISHFGAPADVRRDLENHDVPVAVLVTCAELGFQPDLFSGSRPGGMVIVQTAGGLVMVPGQESQASVIFGDSLAKSQIRHLIFCGHSRCRVFDRLIHDIDAGKELLLYRFAEPALHRLRSDYQGRPAHELCGILIQESLLQQAALVQQLPDVAKRLNDKSLRLHIWVRDDETARLAVFSPAAGQFNIQ